MTRSPTTLPMAAYVLLVLLGVAPAREARAEQGAGPPEPRITFHRSREGVAGVKARLYLKTEPERVWEVVTDPEKAASLFKAVRTIKRSARGPGYWDYHLSSILGEKVVYCAIVRDDRRLHIRWKRFEGDLVDLYGYYKVGRDSAFPDHARVDYASYIDPGGIGRVLMTNGKRRVDVNFMIAQLRRLTE
jgi:hypothetical protein